MGSFSSKLSTNSKNVSLDNLPDLAFEQILSHLALADRLRCRAVSRGWRRKFEFIEVKIFCFSGMPSGLVYGKSRWLSGVFASNFVSSPQFASFFDAYGRTILSGLKHLRLCDLKLNFRNGKAFSPTLNSFNQLEHLDIIRMCYSQDDRRWKPNTGRYLEPKWDAVIELHLPMLEVVHLEGLEGIERLTLDARRLKTIKLGDCSALKLRIVHGGSIERLLDNHHFIDDFTKFIVQSEMKNVKYLGLKLGSRDTNSLPTLLPNLKQLKEIYLHCKRDYYSSTYVEYLLEQKQLHRRTDLKIYFHGLLLNGPNDSMLDGLYQLGIKTNSYLLWKPSRIADEIAFRGTFHYVECYESELMTEILSRCTDLNKVCLDRRIRDVERFMKFLQNFDNIANLKFRTTQPQRLFDQLPDHCTIQKLEVCGLYDLNLDFLWRLKDLICFTVDDAINAKWILKAFEQLPFLSTFCFSCCDMQIEIRKYCPKLFKVSTTMIGEKTKSVDVRDLNAAIRYIMRNTKWKGVHPWREG